MNRTVKRSLLDNWIVQNKPNGLGKLAIASGVSENVIAYARVGKIPRKEITRRLIAQTIGVVEDELFPRTEAGKSQAS